MKVPMLHLKPQIDALRDELRAALHRILDTQVFILGPEVQAFESEIGALLSPGQALGVSSGTDALLVALLALDIGPGDEVILPPFTFFATAAAVIRVGARPVFVDIDPATFNIDPKRIEQSITPKTRAIIPVHLYGQCADMERITEIATRHGLKVIEDAAQALGATRHGRPACTLGDLACVSFYPTKNLGAIGEAGLVVTRDPELYAKCRILRNQGMEPRYEHHCIGGNYRMDAIQGAALRAKLKHLPAWNASRSAHAATYDRLLAGTSISTPLVAAGNTHIYHQYTIRVPQRDPMRTWLADHGVASDVYYPIPLHLQPCLRHLGYSPGDFPAAEQAAREVLSLPIFPELSPDQIHWVCDQLLAGLRQHC